RYRLGATTGPADALEGAAAAASSRQESSPSAPSVHLRAASSPLGAKPSVCCSLPCVSPMGVPSGRWAKEFPAGESTGQRKGGRPQRPEGGLWVPLTRVSPGRWRKDADTRSHGRSLGLLLRS